MKQTDATDALWQPVALISWSYSSRGVGTEFDGERNIVVHQGEHMVARFQSRAAAAAVIGRAKVALVQHCCGALQGRR